MPSGKHLSNEEKEAIKLDFENGYKIDFIAKKYNLHSTTIQNICYPPLGYKKGVKILFCAYVIGQQIIKDADSNKNYTLTDLGNLYDMSRSSISRLLNGLGYKKSGRRNYKGLRFGKLLVLHRAQDIPRKYKNREVIETRWLCKCDCGNTSIVSTSNLGHGTSSCGCLEDANRKRIHKNNITHGATRFGKQTPEYRLYNSVRKRARDKGLPFDLEYEDIVIPEYCPILGIKIKTDNHVGGAHDSPSVDRIIPNLGYVKSNIAIISLRANWIKADASLAELEKITNWLRCMTKLNG